MSEIEQMREAIAKLESPRSFSNESYPKGLTAFPDVLRGQGFFPGGDGLWRATPSSTEAPPFQIGGAMILGNDFGCLDNPDSNNPGFIQCLEKGYENPPTWGIKIMLEKAGIPGNCCFFTNSYLGLRTKTNPKKPCKGTGPSPGTQDHNFVTMCRNFFKCQLATQRPRLIVCLGHEPRTFVGPMLLPAKHAWNRKSLSFPRLDLACEQILRTSNQLPGGRVLHSIMVVIAHPSFAFSTHWQPASMRTFKEKRGAEAEIALLSCA